MTQSHHCITFAASAPIRRGQYECLLHKSHVAAVGAGEPFFGFAMDDAQTGEGVEVYVTNRETLEGRAAPQR